MVKLEEIYLEGPRSSNRIGGFFYGKTLTPQSDLHGEEEK